MKTRGSELLAMYRLTVGLVGLGILLTGLFAQEADARRRPKAQARDEVSEKAGLEAAESSKPVFLGSFGEWGAYRTQNGKVKVCYILGKPKERQPSGTGRDASYVLVSTRPSDGVRNEVFVIMGFPMKEGTIGEGADVNGSKFDLIAKGQNAWVKDSAEETKMVDTMRRGSRLLIKASSTRGKAGSDLYLLDGVSDALDRVAKECR